MGTIGCFPGIIDLFEISSGRKISDNKICRTKGIYSLKPLKLLCLVSSVARRADELQPSRTGNPKMRNHKGAKATQLGTSVPDEFQLTVGS